MAPVVSRARCRPQQTGGDLRMLSGAAADPFRREHATPRQPLRGALLPQRGVASPAKAGSPPGRTLRPFPPTGPPAVPGPESFHQPSPGRQLCPACRTPAFLREDAARLPRRDAHDSTRRAGRPREPGGRAAGRPGASECSASHRRCFLVFSFVFCLLPAFKRTEGQLMVFDQRLVLESFGKERLSRPSVQGPPRSGTEAPLLGRSPVRPGPGAAVRSAP